MYQPQWFFRYFLLQGYVWHNNILITQQVRKAVLDDQAASMYARNIKVITRNAVVTLKGPMQSIEEPVMIEAVASKVPGVGRVENEIEVMSH